MRSTHVFVVAALLSIAGTARASSASPIPSNYIDDFGPIATPATSAAQPAPAYSSPVFANYIDNFGPLVPDRVDGQEELGAGGGEPGMDVNAADRAQEEAARTSYEREQFLRSVWAPTP